MLLTRSPQLRLDHRKLVLCQCYVFSKIFNMYFNLFLSSVNSMRLNHVFILGFTPRVNSSAFVYRNYLFFIPSLCRFQFIRCKVFDWPVPDLEVLFYRELVEDYGSQAKSFCRFLELSQKLICLHLSVRNLPPFFLLLCFLMNLLMHIYVSGLSPSFELSFLVVSTWMFFVVMFHMSSAPLLTILFIKCRLILV